MRLSVFRSSNFDLQSSNPLFAPVDIASIAVFRIVFGALLALEIVGLFRTGWIERHLVTPEFHFTYHGFEWVQPLPGDGMYWLCGGLGVLALGIAAGCGYRLCCGLFCAGFTYVFLIDTANYLNHFYLICLLSFLLTWLPAHGLWSVDAAWRPRVRRETIPAWMVWLLRAQIGCVYFFGGVSKLNDDWLHGEPMRFWMSERADSFPLIGRYFHDEWMVSALSYGALALDLLIVPLLLWRKTRFAAFVVAVLFHLLNAKLWTIGIFPWLMIAATLLYFPGDWPRRFCRVGCAHQVQRESDALMKTHWWAQPTLLRAATVYVAVQFVLPFTHWLYPGNVLWTGEGHRFGWHMLHRRTEGVTAFEVRDAVTGEKLFVDPTRYLAPHQFKQLPGRPDMLWQFSNHLADVLTEPEKPRVEVRAKTLVSLNGRAPQAIVDPNVNLAGVPLSWRPSPWILPLRESLP